MIHRILSQLAAATLRTFPAKWINIGTTASPRYLLVISNGALSGTANGVVGINIASGAATAARVYVDNAGTWAALS